MVVNPAAVYKANARVFPVAYPVTEYTMAHGNVIKQPFCAHTVNVCAPFPEAVVGGYTFIIPSLFVAAVAIVLFPI